MIETTFPTGKLPLEYLQELLGAFVSDNKRLIAGPGVGEDVAVIDMGDRYMVVKTDPITFASDQIGWYAVNINANDIATSGATPLWMLNTILLPEKSTTPTMVEEIFQQLREACHELNITLIGGHTEVTYGLDRPIVVGVMIGEVAREKLITTAGAQEGDTLLLVKGIPIEATAIIAREKATTLRQRGYSQAFIARAQAFLYNPGISVLEAANLAASQPGIHAMHDPTEGGLATGIHEMACAASTGAWLDADAIPLLPEGAQLCQEFGLDPLGVIASGALLMAVAPESADAFLALYAEAGIPCTRIGTLPPAREGLIMRRQGRSWPLPRFDTDEITHIF